MRTYDEWSAEDYIRESLLLVESIHADASTSIDTARVFFQFEPAERAMEEDWGEDASYVSAAREAFRCLPTDLKPNYVGGWSGIEVFENVVPTEEWVRERIPQMIEVARKAGIRFTGWTFMPFDKPSRGFKD